MIPLVKLELKPFYAKKKMQILKNMAAKTWLPW